MLLHDFKNQLDLAVSSLTPPMQLLLLMGIECERRSNAGSMEEALEKGIPIEREETRPLLDKVRSIYMSILSFFSIFPISEKFS